MKLNCVMHCKCGEREKNLIIQMNIGGNDDDDGDDDDNEDNGVNSGNDNANDFQIILMEVVVLKTFHDNGYVLMRYC